MVARKTFSESPLKSFDGFDIAFKVRRLSYTLTAGERTRSKHVRAGRYFLMWNNETSMYGISSLVCFEHNIIYMIRRGQIWCHNEWFQRHELTYGREASTIDRQWCRLLGTVFPMQSAQLFSTEIDNSQVSAKTHKSTSLCYFNIRV